jgi:SH3-like domain-containing protein
MIIESPSILELLGKGATFEAFTRYAAQQMIALAMEAEITAVIKQYQHIKRPNGKAAVVRKRLSSGTRTIA